jgi:transposase
MATEGVAMGQAVAVRTDYTASEVRRLAKRAKDAAQARRLLAIAAVFDGASRAAAAKIGGMDRQTLRDWVIRFNRQGPDGLFNIPSPGVPPKLDATHRAFLARIVEEGPIPAVHGAASISRSISASIRYSRVRSSALGRLRGRTVRFSIPDTSVVTSVFPMQIPHPGHALFREGAFFEQFRTRDPSKFREP